MRILSIDTSCDETSVAVTDGRRVLSNVIYSQVLIHKKWGGVVPSLAKRAHEERIDLVVDEALEPARLRSEAGKPRRLNWQDIDYFAVTQGPGLAVALEVGIKKTKELAQKYNKKIISVNHMEGHIYSCFVQNSKGKPVRDFNFPYLALLISGGHTELVLFKNHLEFEVIGRTIDDAAGEALDKAAKLLGLGYPGGAVIERLAGEAGNLDFHKFPRPMLKSDNLDFSFSGLKTAFYYFLKNDDFVIPAPCLPVGRKAGIQTGSPIKSGMTKGLRYDLRQLASSFQEAVFDTLLFKTEKAMKQTGINRLVVGGGVVANLYLRKKLRQLVKKYKGSVLFPPFKYLTGDNAAMIGVAAAYKAEKGLFIDPKKLDRIPRMSL